MSSLLPWPSAYLASAGWHSVSALLERCVALSRGAGLPGTVMLVGEPGLGREALAVELAAALICRGEQRPPCDCPSCRRVRRGVHPDLEVLDVAADAAEIKIEQVRDVVDTLAQLPFEGRRRVIVVASSHTPPLNTVAASALLKSLEEPPAHVTFVLLAANPARVLPTVVSRAVQVRVPPPARQELVATLADAHGIAPDVAESHLVACLEDGHTAILTDPNEGAQAVAGAVARTSAALGGDALAALCLGARARARPEAMPIVARTLVAGAAGLDAERAEAALDAAAAMLRAIRRRAVLHLDAESVTVGALAPLLKRRR